MKAKLIKTEIAQYEAGAWAGKNNSGRVALGEFILVLPDKAEDRTKSGIIFTDEQVERQSMATQSGILVAVGAGAFIWNHDRTRPFEGYKPQPGDRVHFARYSGQRIIGQDDEMYLLMEDRVVAAIDEEVDPVDGLLTK